MGGLVQVERLPEPVVKPLIEVFDRVVSLAQQPAASAEDGQHQHSERRLDADNPRDEQSDQHTHTYHANEHEREHNDPSRHLLDDLHRNKPLSRISQNVRTRPRVSKSCSVFP